MNETLQKYARDYLKKGLEVLPEGNVQMFKRMYSHKNLGLDINTVVDRMPEDKLDWAMEQVRLSIEKREVEVTKDYPHIHLKLIYANGCIPGWYFSDEVDEMHGPFDTLEETQKILAEYGDCLMADRMES